MVVVWVVLRFMPGGALMRTWEWVEHSVTQYFILGSLEVDEGLRSRCCMIGYVREMSIDGRHSLRASEGLHVLLRGSAILSATDKR